MKLRLGVILAAAHILVASGLMIAAPTPSGLPTGAVAYYDFGSIAGGAVPNQIQTTGALPGLTIRGADFQVSDGDTIWNRNIGSFTFRFPFDSSRGTYAETPSSFPNFFSGGGTTAVRLRLDSSVVTTLGQASSMGVITFRPEPDINIHRVTPRGIEIRRDGPTDPLHFLVREGNNSIGHNSEFNDEVRSGPIVDTTIDHTAIVVWNAQTLRIYVDGVLSGTTSRVTADHPTPAYRIMVAVQPSLIHSGDNQFYKGAIRSYVVYNRALSSTEAANLHSALSGSATQPSPPSPPQNLRIVS